MRLEIQGDILASKILNEVEALPVHLARWESQQGVAPVRGSVKPPVQ
jgi:hypothetical protein